MNMKRVECEGVGDDNGFFEFTPNQAQTDNSNVVKSWLPVEHNSPNVSEEVQIALYPDFSDEAVVGHMSFDAHGHRRFNDNDGREVVPTHWFLMPSLPST